MDILDVGGRAVLAQVRDSAEARSLAAWARRLRVGAGEVVPAAATVLFDDVADPGRLRTLLGEWRPDAATPAGELVEVAVRYDGPDLAFVAELWGTDESGVVEHHTSIEFVAAFCGFAPGFSYLEGLAERHAVPRMDSPRSRVPAGAVALAGSWCGVYPTASPGGWRILGTTQVALWNPERSDPALLAPGTRVRFVPA